MKIIQLDHWNECTKTARTSKITNNFQNFQLMFKGLEEKKSMTVLAEHENVLITQSLHPITYTKNVWVKNLIVHLNLSNLIKRS